MLKEHPAPTAAQLAKIEQLEQEAKDALRRQEESWERSDTDGFLSQWANGMTASLNRRKIEVLRCGGYAQFWVLVHEATGTVIATESVTFSLRDQPWIKNTKWRVEDEHLHLTNGRKWIPVQRGDKPGRIAKSFGLVEDQRWFRAEAKIMGSGTGLSGCANAFVGVERVRDYVPQRAQARRA